MFSIGEFSVITRLSVKTLRYYHDEGLLVPDYIDEDSGYRYYRKSSVDKAAILSLLRSMEFSISEIKEVLWNYQEDEDILEFLLTKRKKIKQLIDRYKIVDSSIDSLVSTIRSNEMVNKNINFEVIEKDIDDCIFASQRFKGIYEDVGKVFGLIGKKAGRHIAGNPMSLYYDGEYKEKDADIEAGFPLSKSIRKENILCNILKGGRAVTVIHKGPYEQLGRSYEKLYGYIEDKKLAVSLPTREVYLKGPGMIFRGNPENYLTEIQIFIK